ncbi:MAG: L-fucose isomerase [Clostridiales bacterium]|nr:L-fucose isomerase [Clostridiales bacterium]
MIGKERLRGTLPKVGIRPTIDGRRKGVRESIEPITMNMAITAAKLISENLKYPNGQPVECVIADECIGGVAEAAECAEKFRKEGVGLTLTVTPSWCYGSETMDMDSHLPKAIWGFNGTERPGAVYLAAVLAAHSQKGLPAFGIYGRDVQDMEDTSIPKDVVDRILTFVKSGLAVAYMKGKSYVSFGSVSMGIAGSIADESFYQKYLGIRNEYVDMSEFIRRMQEDIYDKEEFNKALAWTKKNCIEGKDTNPLDIQRSRKQKDGDWETSVKMALIARDIMVGNSKLKDIGYGEEALGRNAIMSGFQGQRMWTDFMPNGDFLEAILNSSFDWNGIRQPYIVATENDGLNGVTMLFGHLLTGTAQIFADVRTYWSADAVKRVTGKQLTGLAKDGIIHLINSGAAALDGTGQQQINGKAAMKPFYDITEEEKQKCLDNTTWGPASLGYFRGGGFSSTFLTVGKMPVTMARINIVDGLGPFLQIAEGYTVELPSDVHEKLNKRTDPTWPTTWFAPTLTGEGAFSDVYSVMANWGANHGVLSYGHIGDQLITLASMLRIPVSMHNVASERIFRPSSWSAFGTSNQEGADYRACDNFGPLYK